MLVDGEGSSSVRELALSVISHRQHRRSGSISDADYLRVLARAGEGLDDPRGVRLLDEVAFVAVELLDTLAACIDALGGPGSMTTSEILWTYSTDGGVPYR